MNNEDILSNNVIIKQDLFVIRRAICIAFWNCCGLYVPKNVGLYC